MYNCCVLWLYVCIEIYTLQLYIIDLTQRGCHTLRSHFYFYFTFTSQLIGTNNGTRPTVIFVILPTALAHRFLCPSPSYAVGTKSSLAAYHIARTVSTVGIRTVGWWFCRGVGGWLWRSAEPFIGNRYWFCGTASGSSVVKVLPIPADMIRPSIV